MSETTTDTTTTDEGGISYEEINGQWVQIDTRGDQEQRTVVGPVVADEDHPNKPEGWEPDYETDILPTLEPRVQVGTLDADTASDTADTGNPPPPADSSTAKTSEELDAMTQPELLAYAQSLGVEGVNTSTNKTDLRAAIDAKQSG